MKTISNGNTRHIYRKVISNNHYIMILLHRYIPHKIAIIELCTRVRNRSALENACNPSCGADTCSPVIIIVFIHAAHSLNTLFRKNSRELRRTNIQNFLNSLHCTCVIISCQRELTLCTCKALRIEGKEVNIPRIAR